MNERRTAFLRIDPSVFHEACLTLATLDLLPDVSSVTIPTLVLVGDEDEATPPDMSKELHANLIDIRLVVVEGCAHVPQLQAPDVFLEAIQKFLIDGARGPRV